MLFSFGNSIFFYLYVLKNPNIMKYKFYVFLITITLLIFITDNIFAKKVEIPNAKRVAVNFYYERINQYYKTEYDNIKIKEVFIEKYDNEAVYYIFNIKEKGYVIVSANDVAYPVLAYSFNRAYQPDNQPPQFITWMKQYKAQIIYAINNNIKVTEKTIKAWEHLLSNDKNSLLILRDEKQVLPLITSIWDQGTYYNEMCPADPAGPGGHVWAGCVATAMCQVMYYFRFPITGTGSYTYYHPVYGMLSANFGNTTYKWNNMVNYLNESNLSVAELLYHCGVSVDMDYGPNGSGMWNHKAAYSLKTYFNYLLKTEYVFRDSTNLNWDSLLITHLDKKIPMYYAGWSVPNVNGHAFVCDGYQKGNYYHFNWGWSGSYDGYFYLDNLTPGGHNFNLAQELIINCFPDTINFNYPYYCKGIDTLKSKSGTIDDGSGPVYNYQNHTHCSWLISPQTAQDSVTNIILNFDRFETEDLNDILTVYDGETTAAPVLGVFSGSNLPKPITSTANKIFIKFFSNDKTTATGWLLSYTSTIPVWCNGLTNLTAVTDTFSDGSGSFNYYNGTTCMWNITPEAAITITLNFTEFNTEEDKDLVKIYNAANNQLLATYSGNYSPSNLPEPVTSPSGKMFVTFCSNNYITAPGWEAYYTISTTDIDNKNNVLYDLNIFPNPANNLLYLSFSTNETQSLTLKLISIKGKTIYTENKNNLSVKY